MARLNDVFNGILGISSGILAWMLYPGHHAKSLLTSQIALVLAVVGVSHETADFAMAAIHRWWLEIGEVRYPGCHQLLIQADSGGANACDSWLWKAALQTLADQLDITITVSHYPTGASKWNLIEHRMFCVISQNWAGQPLDCYETMLKFIRTSTTQTGFRCLAHFDRRKYPSKQKLSPDERANLNLHYHRLLPEWNYTIKPHPA